MEYSTGMEFQTSIINMDKSKSITMNSRPGKSEYKKKTVLVWILRALAYHLKGIPYRDSLPKRRKSPCRWVFLNKKRRRQQKMH